MTVTRGEGVKISENVADVIYGSPILDTYLGREKKMLRVENDRKGFLALRPQP